MHMHIKLQGLCKHTGLQQCCHHQHLSLLCSLPFLTEDTEMLLEVLVLRVFRCYIPAPKIWLQSRQAFSRTLNNVV